MARAPTRPRAAAAKKKTRPPERKLRSRITTDGLDRAPHRAFYRAMGLDDAAMARPMIAVMSTHGENTPCSMPLREQADAARMGVAAAGGTPREFSTISVADGLSMNVCSAAGGRETKNCIGRHW